MKDLEVSIILPAYNEQETIGKVIDDVKKAMEKTTYSYEIIVVDDGSEDRTAEIAASKGIRLIRRVLNGGSGAARKTGIRAAKGEIIVMLDADGTYAAYDIPKMLGCFPEYDQVVGVRTREKGRIKFLRVPAKWMIRRLACFLAGQDIPDLNSGLRAFKKDIMKRYLWVIPDGFSCVTSMTLSFLCNGYTIKWFPTEYYSRIGTSKFHPVKDTYNYILTVIRMIMYFDPLKILLPLSLSLFVFGVIKSLYDWFFVVRKMQASDIVILMTAVLIGVLGLIADLIVAHAKAGYDEV